MVIGQLSSIFKKVRKILFWDDRIIWKCIADDSTNKTRIKQRNWLSIMINHKLEKSIARKWRRVKNKADEYLVVSYLIFMEVYSTLELYTLFEKSIAEGIDTRRGMEGNKKQGWKRLQSRFDVVVIIQGCRGILNVWRSYTSIRFFLFFFSSLDRMAPATMTRNEICEHSHVIDASETWTNLQRVDIPTRELERVKEYIYY